MAAKWQASMGGLENVMCKIKCSFYKGVLKVKFTKCRTCARRNHGEQARIPGMTGVLFISMLEPHMLKAYLGKQLEIERPMVRPLRLPACVTRNAQIFDILGKGASTPCGFWTLELDFKIDD